MGKKQISPWTCPKCKSRATKIINISVPATEAILCQICDHKYPFPSQAQPAPFNLVNDVLGRSMK